MEKLENFVNYIPRVVRVAQQGADPRPENIIVTFSLEIEGVLHGEFTYSMDALRTLDYTQLDYRCHNLNEAVKKRRVLLFEEIRKQIANFDLSKNYYIQQTGWTTIGDAHVFVAGDKIIGETGFVEPKGISINAALQNLHLDVGPKSTLPLFCMLMFTLGGNVSICAFLYFIYTLLRPIFAEAGWNHPFICYLVGHSQSRKTTFAEILTQVFNRGSKESSPQPQSISLLSTKPAILKDLGSYHGICRLVDDLYVASSRAEAHRKEEMLSDLIRLVGNDTARKTTQGQKVVEASIPCGVICTAEHLPQGYSTLARCLILTVKQPLNSIMLTYFQRDGLIWPTFTYQFLCWCAKQYPKLVDYVRANASRFYDRRSKSSMQQGRLDEIAFSLQITFGILLKYIGPLRSTASHRGKPEHIKTAFLQGIESVIREQAELLKQAERVSNGWSIPTAIATLYTEEIIKVTKHKKERVTYKNTAIERKGCLCMRPEYLLGLLRNYFRDPTLTLQQVTGELRKANLLNMDASRKSTKKLYGVRMLHIYLQELIDNYGPPDIFDNTDGYSEI